MDALRLTALLLLVSGSSYAQQFYLWEYTSEDGLESELVKSVAHDDRGFVWVATDGGLYYYDGIDFAKATADSLIYIKDIYLDSEGRLLMSSDYGLHQILRDKKKQFRIEPLLTPSIVAARSSLYIKELYESKDGTLWTSDVRRIWRERPGGSFQSYYFGSKEEAESFTRSFSFVETDEGHLYAFSNRGNLYRYHPDIDDFKPCVPTTEPLRSFVNRVVRHVSGRMIVATEQGLYLLDIDTSTDTYRLTPYLRDQVSHSSDIVPYGDRYIVSSFNKGLLLLDVERETTRVLPGRYSNNINSVSVGADSSIWVATGSGMYHLIPTVVAQPYPELYGSTIVNFQTVDDNTVLIATDTKIYTTTGDYASLRPLLAAPKGKSIRKVLYDAKRQLIYWSDTEGGIHIHNRQGGHLNSLSDTHVAQLLLLDSQGRVWLHHEKRNRIGYFYPDRSERVHLLGQEQGILQPVYSALEHNGMLYFSGRLKDPAVVVLDALTLDARERQPWLPEMAYDRQIIYETIVHDGDVLLCSSYGLLRIEDDTIRPYNPYRNTYPLTGNNAGATATDGTLWLSTSEGLMQLRPEHAIRLDEKNGLPSKLGSRNAVHVGPQGLLWVGSNDGLGRLDSRFELKPTPEPVLTRLYGKAVQRVQDTWYLNTGEQYQLTFRTPIYPGRQVVYQYRMGEAGPWLPITERNRLLLSGLEEGMAALYIRACYRGGYAWSDPLVIPLNVRAPFVGSALWVILIVLGLALGGVFIVQFGLQYTADQKAHLNEQIRAQTRILTQRQQELEARNVELVAAREAAEAASDAKQKFLSVMSHEIRTPMNAVVGISNVLLDRDPAPEQIEDLRTLQFASRHLIDVINDILDYSKLSAEKVELDAQDFNLYLLCRAIRHSLKHKVDEQGIEMRLAYDERLEHYFHGDDVRIKQILWNLCSNAVKFTSSGSVTLRLTHLSSAPEAQRIRFEVIDTGIGIPKDKISTIFNSFEQADSSTTRAYGGTGLGLSISKYLLELFGSEIEIESTVGEGSTFAFELALGHAKEQGTIETPKAPDDIPDQFRGERVLVVEDNKLNVMVLNKFLSTWNLTVDHAENGQLALECIESTPYRLILMDLQMPVMGGLEATRHIRRMPSMYNRNLPIVALTASATTETHRNALANGMDDFVTKPFNPIQLKATIAKYLLTDADPPAATESRSDISTDSTIPAAAPMQ